MSRRDYLRAAELIRAATYLDDTARRRLVEDLAAWFAADNLRFKPERFYNACASGSSSSSRRVT